VQLVVWNRTFLQSKDDAKENRKLLFELGPRQSKVKDIICIFFFFGCSMPILIRECSTDNNFFEFVGQCYIDEVMDGEAIPSKNQSYPYPLV